MATTSTSARTQQHEVNNKLGSSLKLPCSGVTLPNRIAKAAMTEWMADPSTNLPNEDHINIYRIWAEGGVGLSITGNVQIDRRYMESPRNIAAEQQDLDDPHAMELWKRWASACKTGGSIAIVQLGCAGRQTPKSVNFTPIAPSAIQTAIPGLPAGYMSPFGKPREMSKADIAESIDRFVLASKICHKAGFDGVQIHGAHGYLVSSFLSPKSNKRTDEYGGSAESRRRFLLQIVQRVRAELPADFIISVKLNSADFQKGGFSEEESLAVSMELSKMKVDLLEISGGTYEAAVMMTGGSDSDSEKLDLKRDELLAKSNPIVKESTKQREAFFIEHVEKMRQQLNSSNQIKEKQMKVMLTGGWRSGRSMLQAIEDGLVDVIGIARPLCVEPQFPRRLVSMKDVDEQAPEYKVAIDSKLLNDTIRSSLTGAIQTPWHTSQMRRLARGEKVDYDISYVPMLTVDFVRGFFFEPRKNKEVGLALYCGYIASLIGVAAYGWKSLFAYLGYT